MGGGGVGGYFPPQSLLRHVQATSYFAEYNSSRFGVNDATSSLKEVERG